MRNILYFKAALVFLLVLYATSYFESNTIRTRVEYFDVPCLNKITKFTGKLKVYNGPGIGYEPVSKYEIRPDNLGEDMDKVVKTIHNGVFEIVGYYVVLTQSPLTGLGGGPLPYYLLRDVETNEKYWVVYFMVDSKSCKLVDDFSDNAFNISEAKDKLYRKKETQLPKQTFKKEIYLSFAVVIILYGRRIIVSFLAMFFMKIINFIKSKVP